LFPLLEKKLGVQAEQAYHRKITHALFLRTKRAVGFPEDTRYMVSIRLVDMLTDQTVYQGNYPLLGRTLGRGAAHQIAIDLGAYVAKQKQPVS